MSNNLLKATKVIGLPVYTQGGEKLQKVEDVIYDPGANQVKALVVDEGGLFSDSKVILIEDVENIGKDVVLVADKDKIKRLEEAGVEVANIAKKNSYLTKTKVITEDGENLGIVSDLLFDPEDGRVEELEGSSGAMGNMRSGKKLVNVSDIKSIGKDATIVGSGVARDFEEQARRQGLTGKLNETKAKAAEKYSQVRDSQQTRGMMEEGKQKAENLKGEVLERVDKLQRKASEVASSDEAINLLDAAKMELIKIKDAFDPKIRQLNDNIEKQANEYRQRQKQGEKYTPPPQRSSQRISGAMGGEAETENKEEDNDIK